MIFQLEKDKSLAVAGVTATKKALSEALGYLNPLAVNGIEREKELYSIDEVRLLDELSVSTEAEFQSRERRQLEYLIKSAKKVNTDLLFRWTDPNGDSDFGLGFNLIPLYKISRS